MNDKVFQELEKLMKENRDVLIRLKECDPEYYSAKNIIKRDKEKR